MDPKERERLLEQRPVVTVWVDIDQFVERRMAAHETPAEQVELRKSQYKMLFNMKWDFTLAGSPYRRLNRDGLREILECE